MPSIAMSDHSNLFGAYEYQQNLLCPAKELNIPLLATNDAAEPGPRVGEPQATCAPPS
jgi:hypothetical protein